MINYSFLYLHFCKILEIMDKNIPANSRKRGILMFVSSILVALFWFFANTINVYEYKVIGAIFEILWLPMMAMLAVVPLLCIFFWRKEQWHFRTLYPICLTLHLLLVLFLVFGN